MNIRIRIQVLLCLLMLSGQLFAQTPNFTNAEYKKALWMTTRFYGGQRAGENNWLLYDHLPTGVSASLRGKSFLNDGDAGYNLSGGWFDCGDHVKFGQTEFYSAYMLLKGYAEFPTGYGDYYAYDYQGYKSAGNWSWEGSGHSPNGIPDILDEVKHATDYFIKCTKDASTFYYQVGQGNPDHQLWETAVQMQTQSASNGGEPRVAYKNPSGASMSSFCGAALALMSRLYRPYDPAYADLCLAHAKYAYAYSKAHPGTAATGDGGFYSANSEWKDDYSSMCAELFWATNTASYKTEALSFSIAKNSGADIKGNSYGFDYSNNGDIAVYNQFLLGNTNAKTVFNEIIGMYIGNVQADGQFNGGNTSWGPTRYNANTAFMVALWQKSQGTDAIPHKYIYDNIDYLLGKNPSNQSFIVGFGAKSPKHPHHRNVYLVDGNPSDAAKANMSIPTKNQQFGLMVGGTRNASTFKDNVVDYQNTEGGIDYNACLVGVLAYINSVVAPVSQHPSPNLGPDKSLCGVGSIILNSGIPTDGKKTFTWKKGTTTIQAASTTANTLSINAAGTYTCILDSLGKWSSTDDIVITATLPAVNLGAAVQLCNPATATLDIGATSAGYTYEWKKNNVIISGATSQTYSVSSAGTYVGTLSASGCTSTSGSIVVTSSLPIAGNDTLCKAGSAALSITGSGGPYQWYAASTGGSSLITGNNYAPNVTTNTTFYVQDGSSVNLTAGPSSTNNTLTGGSNGGAVGFQFTAAKAFNITELKVIPFVYSCNPGDNVFVTFDLMLNGNKLGSYTSANVACTGSQSGSPFNTYYTLTFPTPISIPSAGNYSLTPSGGNALVLFSGGANYTTMDAAGVMDITASTRNDLPNSFPGIVDIKVQSGSSCARTPVYAIIDATYPNCTTPKTDQTITFDPILAKKYGDTNFTLAATASSSLPVTYSSNNPLVATVTPAGLVTIVGVGSVVITASQAGNATYNAAIAVPQTLVVGKGDQTITFGQITSKKVGDLNFTLAATASSGLAISYTSSDLTVATVNATTGVVTIVGVGTTTITAIQAGNGNYTAATSVTQALIVSKASQIITFSAIVSKKVGDTNFTLAATASSGLAVTYASSDLTVATVNATTGLITIVGAGSTIITASQVGNVKYDAATPVTQTLVVGKAIQTITFPAIVSKKVGAPDFTLAATASSGLAITYTSSNLTVATVDATTGVVTIVGEGSTSITASQAGNDNYTAAVSVIQTLVVGKANQTITFTPITTKVVGDPTFNLAATATSGLLVTYTSSDPTVATVTSAGVVTIVGSGSTIITASQAGDVNFTAATDVKQTLLVTSPTKTNQTITFVPIVSKEVGDPDFALTAIASSGLAVTYTSSNPSVATVTSAGVVTIVGIGTTSITASQIGNVTYNPANPVIQSLVITKKVQTITFVPITGSKVFGDPSFTVSASSTSSLPIKYTSNNPSVATVNATTGVVTIVGAGTVIITANQAGNSTYGAATTPQTIVIAKANQTISFGSIVPKKVGDPKFNLVATSSSTLALTFTSSNPAVATVSNTGLVTIVGPGTTTITANQIGNANYNAADPVMQELVVTTPIKVDQTITFGPLSAKMVGDAKVSLAATATSGLPITYTSSNPSVATVTSAGVLTIVGVGTTTIIANQLGSINYNAATPVSQPLVVGKGNQTITFATIAPKVIGSSNFTISAIASSGLAVTYTSSDLSVATVNPTTGEVTIVGVGSTNISANQIGNSNYNAAPIVSQPFVVTKKNQTITFSSIGIKIIGDADFTVSATASSGLVVSYTSSNPSVAIINSAGVVTIVGVGSTNIIASQIGNATFNAASSVPQQLIVNNPAKMNQTITFDPIPVKVFGDASITLSAIASSGLPVTYTSSNPSVATVNSAGVVTIIGVGSTNIIANQEGNVTYNAASQVIQILTVAEPDKINQTITFDEIPSKVISDITFTLTATATSGLPVMYVSSNPAVATVNSAGDVTIVGLGSSIITAIQGGNSLYNAASSVAQTLIVNKEEQTITFDALPLSNIGDPNIVLTATASSGLTVSYVSSNPAVATVIGSNIIKIISYGTAIITASQNGDAVYNAAPIVKQTLTVQDPFANSAIQVLAGSTVLNSNENVINIGSNEFNTPTIPYTFTIKNTGSIDLKVSQITISTGFYLTSLDPSIIIGPDSSATFTAAGIPNDPSAPRAGFISIVSSDIRSTFIINITVQVGPISTPTGITNLIASSAIELYPNPTTSYSELKFNGAFDDVFVTIYAADGSKVVTEDLSSVNNTSRQLDVQDIPSGVYFVEINTAQGKLMKRLIKQ